MSLKNCATSTNIRCPSGGTGELPHLSFVGEGDAAGPEHGRGAFVPGAVFVVAHKRKAPAGKLHTDLVASAGVEPDADEGGVVAGQTGKSKARGFYTGTLPLDHKDLILPAILKQKIFPISHFRRLPMDLRHVFLDHFSLLDQLGELSSGSFCPGKDHHTAHLTVKPVKRKNFSYSLRAQNINHIFSALLITLR